MKNGEVDDMVIDLTNKVKCILNTIVLATACFPADQVLGLWGAVLAHFTWGLIRNLKIEAVFSRFSLILNNISVSKTGTRFIVSFWTWSKMFVSSSVNARNYNVLNCLSKLVRWIWLFPYKNTLKIMSLTKAIWASKIAIIFSGTSQVLKVVSNASFYSRLWIRECLIFWRLFVWNVAKMLHLIIQAYNKAYIRLA